MGLVRQHDIPFVFSSPYARAKQTADTIAEEIKSHNPKLIVSALLAEQNFGTATGYPSHEEYANSHLEQQQLLFKRPLFIATD